MDLVKQLKDDGITKGLCRLWQGKLKPGTNIGTLCSMFVAGIDFCISENYPTLEFLRENLKGKCEEFGIFIDDQVSITNLSDSVLNGSCSANLVYSDYTVSRLYIRHNSKAIIDICDHAIVTVDAFDNSSLEITASEGTKVLINLYGNAIVKTNSEGIKIRRLYKSYY